MKRNRSRSRGRANAKPSTAPPRFAGQPPDGPGGRCSGQIVRFEESKGFGFIQPDRDLNGEDLFFLRGQLPPHLAHARYEQIIDARVDFDVETGREGKLRAIRIEMIGPPAMGSIAGHGGCGGPPPPQGGNFPIKTGRVCAWDGKKAFGFIKCPDIPEDVFVPKSEMPPELQSFERREDFLDRDVEFELREMPDGKLRAQRCMLLRYPPPPAPGPPPGGPGMLHPMMDPGRGPPPPPYGMPNLAPGRVVGRIRKFDRAKGFGFVERQDGGPDVFFLPSSLPQEMRESRDTFENMEMVFEVYVNEEGKPRARNMVPFAGGPGGPPMGHMGPPPMGHMGPPMGHMGHMGHMMGPPMGPPMGHMMGPPMAMMGPPMGMPMGPPLEGSIAYGTIVRYDMQKGFGFIACETLQEDVFFLRSEMPPELKEEPKDKVMNQQVEFELGRRDDGKWRARKLTLLQQQQRPIREDEIHQGVILRFEEKKGYGFLKPDEIDEDVFFLRSELPPELREFQDKSEVIQRHVEFNVKTMPDGKLRALRLQTIGSEGRENRSRAAREPKDDHPKELDDALLNQMTEFLMQNGGSIDYGRFASTFARVKKKQLEGHFNIVSNDRGSNRGVQRIQLKDYEGDPAEMEGQMEDVEADGNELADDAAADAQEPSIPLGSKGCQPHGVIERYDPIKGVGFIRVVGYPDEIPFQRPSLPSNFQVRSQKFMPSLSGVQVSFNLVTSGDKGKRADQLILMLKYHAEEDLWLLKRESDTAME